MIRLLFETVWDIVSDVAMIVLFLAIGFVAAMALEGLVRLALLVV